MAYSISRKGNGKGPFFETGADIGGAARRSRRIRTDSGVIGHRHGHGLSRDIDAEIGAGRVSAEAFRQLELAEGNGQASPMRWLDARLKHLEAVVRSGRTVEIAAPGGAVRLATVAEFHAWCARTFPDAHAYFFRGEDS